MIRLRLASDLSKGLQVPHDTPLETVAYIYEAQVLLVRWQGSEYYTANPDWTPPAGRPVEPVAAPAPEPTLPWDRPFKRGRGRPRKERT